MNPKRTNLSTPTAASAGQREDARYLAWFHCFNDQRYFEAHDVLEALWLPLRRQPGAEFLQGLIQLAGAFVHLQKDRRGPAATLLRLAAANLERFPDGHERFPVGGTLRWIEVWLHQLGPEGGNLNPLQSGPPPHLGLLADRLVA